MTVVVIAECGHRDPRGFIKGGECRECRGARGRRPNTAGYVSPDQVERRHESISQREQHARHRILANTTGGRR